MTDLSPEFQTEIKNIENQDKATNERIDNLVLESGGDSNLEVADARASSVKNKTFNVIDGRIEEVERDTTVLATNDVVNGDFSNGTTGWAGISVTASIVDDRLYVNEDRDQSKQIYQAMHKNYGHLYYVSFDYVLLSGEFNFRVKGNGVSGGSLSIDTPGSGRASVVEVGDWSETNENGIFTFLSGTECYIDNVLSIDLTNTFGAGNEPSESEMNEMMKYVNGQYFNGTANIANAGYILTTLRALNNRPSGGEGSNLGYVSVTDFGAAGLGADYTAEVRNAVDSIGIEKRGTVFFPDGDYKITEQVNVPENVTLVGAGMGSRILAESPTDAFNLLGSHDGTSWPDTLTNETIEKGLRPQVENLQFRGNRTGGAINASKLMHPAFKSVHISNCGTGITLSNRIRDIFLTDCTIFANANEGLLIDQCNIHQVIINDCHISHNQGGGIVVKGGNVRNIVIDGNDIEYNDDIGVFFDTSTGGSIREINVTGNQTNGNSIKIIGRSDDIHSVGGITVSGNQLGTSGESVDIQYASDIIISANAYIGNGHRAVAIRNCENVVITPGLTNANPAYSSKKGIQVVDTKNITIHAYSMIGESTPTPLGSIELQRCELINISQLNLIDQLADGVFLRDCKTAIVSQSIIKDTLANMVNGISVSGSATEKIYLLDNLIEGATNESIFVDTNVPAGAVAIRELPTA